MLIQDRILKQKNLEIRNFKFRSGEIDAGFFRSQVVLNENKNRVQAIKFFSGMLSNQTLNRDTQSIIVLMAMILENNDLAAPILILQLLKVAVVVGSIEFIAGLLEGLDRTEPDRCGYIEAIRELHGEIRSPSDAEIDNVSIKLLIMYNCELLHIAARVACLSSIKCLLTLGAQAIWSNSIGQPSLRKVSKLNLKRID